MPAPLPILGLHHLAVVTRRPEESVAFYCDVLGFAELPRPPFAFRGAWLYAYGMQIHIIENNADAGDRNDEIDSRASHVAFRVASIEPVRERLEEHGVPYREQVNAGGIHQVFFQDPDGYHIEIAAHGDPSVGYAAP